MIRNIYAVPAVCGFLLLAVWLVFGQTLRHDFVAYDDNDYVYENPQVARGFTAQGVAWAFTSNHANNWHPLTWLSHMLDSQIYGLSPWGHHLSNVLIHAAAAILLFLVLQQMTGDLWPSAFVAAVFAVHPLRVESVAWVAERKDVLSGVFFMLTLGAYLCYSRRPFSLARYLSLVVIFALGLTAKPMLVTLPFVLLLLDYWPLKRMEHGFTPRLLWEKIPLLLLATASCLLTLWAQGDPIAANEHIAFPSRIGNAVISYVAYIGQFFYPLDLAVLYPWFYPPMWKILGATLLLAAICACTVIWKRRCPYIFVGWFWYMIMLLPVIGLIQVGPQSIADRYTYLPQIGLCIAITWGVAQACRSWRYRLLAFGVVSASVLAFFMGSAWRQTSFWQNSETLWTHTLACTTKNFMAHNNLGVALIDKGRLDEAVEQFQKVLAIQPYFPKTHNNMGIVMLNKGRYQEAIDQFNYTLRLNPDYAEAYFNLGLALVQAGRPQEAIVQFQQAVRIDPDLYIVYNNLGNIFLDSGQLQSAIDSYKNVLRLNPDFPEAHYNLGLALVRAGRPQEAIEHYEKALQLDPDLYVVHNNLGNILLDAGRLQEAIDHFRQALRLKPDYPEAHNNLGNALIQLGRPQEAIEHYQQILRLKPDSTTVCYNMAVAYANLGESSAAIETARKALELARSQGQTELAMQIEDWLNSYEGQGVADKEQGAVKSGPEQ